MRKIVSVFGCASRFITCMLRSPGNTNSICSIWAQHHISTYFAIVHTFKPSLHLPRKGERCAISIKRPGLFEQVWMSSLRIYECFTFCAMQHHAVDLLLGTLKPDLPPREFTALQYVKKTAKGSSFNPYKICSYSCGVCWLFLTCDHINSW